MASLHHARFDTTSFDLNRPDFNLLHFTSLHLTSFDLDATPSSIRCITTPHTGIATLRDVAQSLAYNLHEKCRGENARSARSDQNGGDSVTTSATLSLSENATSEKIQILDISVYDRISKLKNELMTNCMRAYVHGVCAVCVKATRSLGDMHLVDKEEQGRKRKGNCFYIIM